MASAFLLSSTILAQGPIQVDFKGKKAFQLPPAIDYNIFLHQSDPGFQEYRDSLGLQDGYWVLFYYDNAELPAVEGAIKDGAPDGEWKSYGLVSLSTGNRTILNTVMNFKGGLENGLFEIYDEAGRVTLNTAYKDGVEHGSYINRFKVSGEIQSEGRYFMGLKAGKWNFYSLPGTLGRSVSFRDSVPADSVNYFSRKETTEGKQQMKKVTDPMLEGPYTIYSNGKPYKILEFHKGKLVYYKQYHLNGELDIEGPCKNLVRLKTKEGSEGFLGLPPRPQWLLIRKGSWTNSNPDTKIPKKFIVEGFEVLY